MKQYYKCPLCSANLDPGEKCDCQENKNTVSTSTISKSPYLNGNLDTGKAGTLKPIHNSIILTYSAIDIKYIY